VSTTTTLGVAEKGKFLQIRITSISHPHLLRVYIWSRDHFDHKGAFRITVDAVGVLQRRLGNVIHVQNIAQGVGEAAQRVADLC
jgi:uncharacterized membrane protein